MCINTIFQVVETYFYCRMYKILNQNVNYQQFKPMSIDSNIFDSIRVKPKKSMKQEPKSLKICEWVDCENAGSHKAPKGRGHEGEFFNFCVDHVREYNKKYNYFEGMDDIQLKSFKDDALTGHRPTWKMGVNSNARSSAKSKAKNGSQNPENQQPFSNSRRTRQNTQTNRARRHLVPAQKNAFEVLKLSQNADTEMIKTRYKELVKLHHPDANGGDSSSEDHLRQIIQAYNILKKAGFC